MTIGLLVLNEKIMTKKIQLRRVFSAQAIANYIGYVYCCLLYAITANPANIHKQRKTFSSLRNGARLCDTAEVINDSTIRYSSDVGLYPVERMPTPIEYIKSRSNQISS